MVPTRAAPGIQKLQSYLDARAMRYEVFEHAEAQSAYEAAVATEAPPTHPAKTIVLRGPGGYALAVIPASQRLDLQKVRAAMNEDGDLRFASEEEIESDFPHFELGAIPPVGPSLPPVEVFDRRLLQHRWILCNGGDRRHSVRIDPMDVLKITTPRVVDACED